MVKGLSKEEKRKRMLDWFHESQSFFQLKDVEKICSTEKGITLNTCKEVLMALVDDGLVDTGKIGTSVYFWSLPSKALAAKAKLVAQMQADVERAQQRNERLAKSLEELRQQQSSQENNEERRAELTASAQEMLALRSGLLAQLAAFQENDPAQVRKWQSEIAACKLACNRWVENIFSLKDWFKKKFNCRDELLEKQFEIPSDLDYIC